MSEEKRNIIVLLRLISTRYLTELPVKSQRNQISSRDRHFLGVLMSTLNKLFGEQQVLSLRQGGDNSLIELDEKLKVYEQNNLADAIADRLQPNFDELLCSITQAEKSRLLANIDAISQVIDDQKMISHLSLIWQCINAVEIKKNVLSKSKKPIPQKTAKKEVLALLVSYRSHLYAEILKAWPYRYGIITNKSGVVFVVGRQGQPVSKKKMPKNLQILKQKCDAINQAIIVFNDNAMSFNSFRGYFNTKTRPIIQQARTTIDNQFLVKITKLLASTNTFFLSFFKTNGEKVACKIEKMAEKSAVDQYICI